MSASGAGGLNYARVKAVFMAAQEQSEAEQRAFVQAQCAAEPEVLAEVLSLLGHVEDADIFETPDAEDPVGLIGVTLDDRYRVESFVAEGGFGYVYRALHLRWARPVAVKVFKPMGEGVTYEEVKKAFVKEGALLNELSRKTTAIVQSYDIGDWTNPAGEPLLFTVLEWLEGASLAETLALTPGARSLSEVRALLGPVAEALAVAHDSGVAHRDVKPDNIYVVEEAGAASVKLLDFGIAKVAAERGRGFQSTAGKVTAFSVGYAAPEQVNRSFGSTGPWTDVYSLALVAAEMLGGQAAYDHSDVLAVMEAAQDPKRRPTPRSLGAPVSEGVERVFAKALEVPSERRYQSVRAFWEALDKAAEGVPNRGPLMLAAAIAVALGLTALVIFW